MQASVVVRVVLTASFLLCCLPLGQAADKRRLSAAPGDASLAAQQDWPNYGNDPGGMRYS